MAHFGVGLKKYIIISTISIYNNGIDDFKVCKGAQDAFLSCNLFDVQ